VISNCVINLSTDKPAVFREAFRVLAPGGRLAIADIIAVRELPAAVRADLEAYAGCVSGAVPAAEVEDVIRGAGFKDVSVELKQGGWWLDDEALDARPLVASALIRATKPLTTSAPRLT